MVTQCTRKQPKGMTLLELSVVIMVLLSMISILLVGGRAWIRGSDRSGCIMNIRKVQQAVRSYQNLNALPDGASLNVLTTLVGPGNFIEPASVCPASGTYTYLDVIPTPGELTMSCSFSSTLDHIPPKYDGW